MKSLYILPICLAGACLPVLAQPETGLPPSPEQNVTDEFIEADLDGNGILGIEEARAAFPDIEFEDANGDSWLNHAEVHAAVGDVQLSSEEVAGNSVVGEYGYWEIRRAVLGEDLAGL